MKWMNEWMNEWMNYGFRGISYKWFENYQTENNLYPLTVLNHQMNMLFVEYHKVLSLVLFFS